MIKPFQENAIFNNLLANQLCDELISVLPLGDLIYPTSFMLTGAAAYALQRESTIEIPNVVFKIRNLDYYYALLDYLDRITTKEMKKYTNRTYFQFQAGALLLFVTLVFDPDNETEVINYNGVPLESYEFINPDLL